MDRRLLRAVSSSFDDLLFNFKLRRDADLQPRGLCGLRTEQAGEHPGIGGRLARDLLEHLDEVHVHAGVALDEVAELLQGWRQLATLAFGPRLGLGVDMRGCATKELMVHTMVSWEPCTGSMR